MHKHTNTEQRCTKKKQKNQESSGKSKQKQPILCHNLHTYILRAYIHTYVCIWISVPMRQSQSQSQKAHQPNTTTQRSTAIVVPPLQRPLTQSAPQRTTTSKKETKKTHSRHAESAANGWQ